MKTARASVIGLVVVLAACTSTPSPEPATTPPPIALRTAESAVPASPCLAAAVTGTLAESDITGLGLRIDPAASPTPVIWPFGWTAPGNFGTYLLVNDAGDVVAGTGDTVSLAAIKQASGWWLVCGPVVRVGPDAAQASPSPSPSVARVPCTANQVDLTAGHPGGPNMGTSYLEVFVELAQGPPCTIPWSPPVTIVGPGGATVVASTTDTDAAPVLLDYITRYYLAWAGDCGPSPTGPLSARIEFSPSAVVTLPLGKFRPSYCGGEIEQQSLVMYADEPG